MSENQPASPPTTRSTALPRFCCPVGRHIPWSVRSSISEVHSRSYLAGIVCCLWPCCLSQEYHEGREPIPRIAYHDASHLIIEMGVSPSVPPLALMCLMSFIPIIPLIITCQRDFNAIAWQIDQQVDGKLSLHIRKKNAFSESVTEAYADINSVYLEMFQDSDPETDEIVWKERLTLASLNGDSVSSPWLPRTTQIHAILEEIYSATLSLLSPSIREAAPSSLAVSAIVGVDSIHLTSCKEPAHDGEELARAEVVVSPPISPPPQPPTSVPSPRPLQLPPELADSALWEVPLHRLVERLRKEFSLHGLPTSLQVITRSCEEMQIAPSHLSKLDAVRVLHRLGISANDL